MQGECILYRALQRAEAMQVVRDAIAAGIFNDLVSPSSIIEVSEEVHLCICLYSGIWQPC